MASRKKPPSFRFVWTIYRRNCKMRNIYFGLSVEEVEKLAQKNCFYCEAEPANECRGVRYNGIDRKNNDKGYVPENCVPCCHRCNSVKGNKLSFQQMRAVGRVLRVLGAENKKARRR